MNRWFMAWLTDFPLLFIQLPAAMTNDRTQLPYDDRRYGTYGFVLRDTEQPVLPGMRRTTETQTHKSSKPSLVSS